VVEGNLDEREVQVFFSYFGRILEVLRFPKVFYVRFEDLRSIQSVEKYIINYKENDQMTINILRGVFPQLTDRKLRLILSSSNIFNFENSTDIYLNNIDFRKLNSLIKEEIPFPFSSSSNKSLVNSYKNGELKKKTLKLTSESFSNCFSGEGFPHAVFLDKTNIPDKHFDDAKLRFKESFYNYSKAFTNVTQSATGFCFEENRNQRPSMELQNGLADDEQNKFIIDLVRIDAGLDVRTTLMIRNIPNRYIQESLLQIINTSFKGLYDFFYLPMDFKVQGIFL
jgi:hypothetical protein